MTTQSRYGFSDLVVDEDVKLPKYAKIVDEMKRATNTRSNVIT